MRVHVFGCAFVYGCARLIRVPCRISRLMCHWSAYGHFMVDHCPWHRQCSGSMQQQQLWLSCKFKSVVSRSSASGACLKERVYTNEGRQWRVCKQTYTQTNTRTMRMLAVACTSVHADMQINRLG